MEEQQWEYCLVHFTSSILYLLTSDGLKKGKIQGGFDGCLAAIAQLGREGWEMTSTNDYGAWFKRAVK